MLQTLNGNLEPSHGVFFCTSSPFLKMSSFLIRNLTYKNIPKPVEGGFFFLNNCAIKSDLLHVIGIMLNQTESCTYIEVKLMGMFSHSWTIYEQLN